MFANIKTFVRMSNVPPISTIQMDVDTGRLCFWTSFFVSGYLFRLSICWPS